MNKKLIQERSDLTKFRTSKDNEMTIEGRFITYNSPTMLKNGVYEQIAKKAVESSLKNNNIRCLFDHKTGKVLGSTKAKTLILDSRNDGLYGKVIINKNDPEAVAVYERVKRQDIDSCSFGFRIIKETSKSYLEGTLYTLSEIDLFEISIVTFPAYNDTYIEARDKKYFNSIQKKKLLMNESLFVGMTTDEKNDFIQSKGKDISLQRKKDFLHYKMNGKTRHNLDESKLRSLTVDEKNRIIEELEEYEERLCINKR